ncbi:MAG: YihY/virulence factor BrkB family protein [Deltaproteobacteria bacterium]|nr:YihY/virulence factor BrkB family protein [Deltaproteobacteria bacterium]
MFNPLTKIMDIYDRLDRSGVTNWPLLAAALSYYTALAAVPVLAICFAVARSLGLEEALNNALRDNFAGQEQVLSILSSFAENLIRNFSGSLLVFTALAFIFWSVYGILWQLEVNFSRIFGYLSDRQAIHRATDYLTIMLVIPIFLVAAGSSNLLVAGLEGALPQRIQTVMKLQPLVAVLMKILPFLVWWLVLTWTYAYFSRGIVRWKERLLGGFLAGLVFQLFQTFYLKAIFAVTSYNAIYGTFAAVPLFLIWLYISWLIVIAGGEATRRFTDFFLTGLPLTRILEPLSFSEMKSLALRTMELTLCRFKEGPGSKPLGLNEMARLLNAPVPYTGRAVNSLMRCGLLASIASPDSDNGPVFLPSADPDCLTPDVVVGKLEELDKF